MTQKPPHRRRPQDTRPRSEVPAYIPTDDEAARHLTGKRTGQNHFAGDLSREDLLKRIARVDQAGEYGAVRIYQGQLAILGSKSANVGVLQHMLEQEEEHLATFDKELLKRRARPTLMTPIWHVAGFALGAGTALMGEKTAMACTTAVEEAIDEHYQSQYEQLGDDALALKATIAKFREEELEHRDIGYANGAEQAPAFPLLSGAIKAGTKLAIWLSERV